MGKMAKPLIVFCLGIGLGYYLTFSFSVKDIFKNTYKGFQIGVYTDLDTANIYALKYKNSIVVKDEELYRVYVAILKDLDNIEDMSKYLSSKDIEYYIRDIDINNKEIVSKINEYEDIMDSNNEIVFLELNKMIMDVYKVSL